MTKVEEMMTSLQPENPALADIIQRYDKVESAYRAILEAIGQGKADAASTTASSSSTVIDFSSKSAIDIQVVGGK